MGRRTSHYIYHYRNDSQYIPRRDPMNKTGRNPEVLTDLTLAQARREYKKRKKKLKKGDELRMMKTTNALMGM